MQINWTLVTYLVIGLFALAGFFRGWWKEGITTIFLIALVFLLQQPGIAEAFIEVVNAIVAAIWNIAPALFDFIAENIFAVETSGTAAIQAEPDEAGTWLFVLVVVVVLAILVSRFLVPGRGIVNVVGSVLGGLVGAFNGFIVVNLVREYLDGRSLPGGTTGPVTEIQLAGQSVAGVASPGLTIQAVDLPRFTILDSLIPWIVIGIGLLIFVALLRTGFGFQGVRVTRRVPPGYQ